MIHGKIGSSSDKLEFHVIRPAIWICSYPRSGNTYLRCLLANYASNSEEPLSLEEVVSATRGEHHEDIYAELTGKKPEERSVEEEMRARISYLDRVRNMTNPWLPMIKAHTLFGATEGHPTYRFSSGDRIVHLVRHPCDVVVSFAHYYDIDIETAVTSVLQDGTYFNGWPHTGYEVISSWSQHTRSWMQDVGAPICRAQYEDLVTRPIETLLKLAEFLGLDRDEARAERAAEFSRFDQLKSEELKGGFSETASTATDGYFRDGRSGQWLEKMTIQQAKRILDHDPDLIQTLGFETLRLAP